MEQLDILDCTLRDGGYCNQWKFGFDNACEIVKGLVAANVDIVECGFLTNRVDYQPNITRFNTLEQIKNTLPQDYCGKSFVCMMNYGEYEISQLPTYNGSGINGIRVAFHKRDMVPALVLCQQIQEKGYDVYIQAMVSLSYSKEEFLSLIQQCNQLMPKAFYIVDSFGSMKKHELIKLFNLAEQYLKPEIAIGFHSHNNMQLAFSNAQTFASMDSRHRKIVDCSVFGMGRGAGNLNTELFVEFLNEIYDQRYDLKPLLRLIDEVLNTFYQRSYWGYSLPNYLSAKHNAHPNYAGFLDDKKTLSIEDMNAIFSMMDERKFSYDKAYVEELYLRYMDQNITQSPNSAEFASHIHGGTVLVIAPGKSAELEKAKICATAANPDIVTIGINFDYPYCNTDYIFVSNLRRFKSLDRSTYSKAIVTSNIAAEDVYLRVSYRDLLNGIESVQDNAGMMLIQYLISLGAEHIILAGVDGYSHDDDQNYAQQNMTYITPNSVLDDMNKGMRTMISQFAKQTDIHFLTTSQLSDVTR